MRMLVLLLLLVNIAFFSWQLGLMPWLPWQPAQFIPVSQQSTPSTEQSSPKKIVLLSEQTTVVNPENSPPVTTTPTVTPVAVVAVDTTKTGTESAVNAENTNPSVDIETTSPIPPVETMTKPVNIETPKPIADTTTTSTERPVTNKSTNIPTLALETSLATPTTPSVATVEITPTMMNDNKASLTASTSATIAIPTTTVVAKSSVTEPKQPAPEPIKKPIKPQNREMCYRAGPYVQSTSAQAAANWFKRRNIYAQVQHREAQMLEFTWVYLPPFKNRQAALQAQQRLLQRGIKDHLIIRTKYHTNGISLGLYRDQLSVERRLREVTAKGFSTVRTEKHYKNSTRYWLNVKIPKGQSDVGVTFGKTFKGSALESMVCE